MKYIKLFLISAAIIAVLISIPHIVSNMENSKNEDTSIENLDMNFQLPGLWVGEYDSEEYRGTIIYDFRIEYGLMHAYAIEYIDQVGQSTQDNTISLSIEELSANQAKAIYYFPYEDYYLEMECNLKLIAPNKLELSYYGDEFSFVEVWTKVKMN